MRYPVSLYPHNVLLIYFNLTLSSILHLSFLHLTSRLSCIGYYSLFSTSYLFQQYIGEYSSVSVLSYESMRRRALNALTTAATCPKNQVCEDLSGIYTKRSDSLPDLWAKRMPVSSMVTPCTWVNGSCQSSRSLLDEKDMMRVAVSRTTLSPPGRSARRAGISRVHTFTRPG